MTTDKNKLSPVNQDKPRVKPVNLEEIGQQANLGTQMVRQIEGNDSLRRILKEVNRRQEIVRAALGPLEELRRIEALSQTLRLSEDFQVASKSLAAFEAQFRLPKIAEATRLFKEFELSGAAAVLNRYKDQTSEIQRSIEAMRAPWLDAQNALGSVAGLAELNAIGSALRTMPTFDVRLADSLRVNLGDWRIPINWPTGIFADPVARTEFYAKRGLNTALTAFPTAAFEEGISIAGIRHAPPPLVAAYDYDVSDKQDEEETAFARTNAAHDQLQRFETQMRRFIDDSMKAAFGDNWIKQRVPGEIRNAWLEKQQRAKDNGEPDWPLIAYADFADYVPIITRNDNWNAVFKPVFQRKTLVQESFQRLYPIRICTMHARLITQDDELYLLVETRRILSAIGFGD